MTDRVWELMLWSVALLATVGGVGGAWLSRVEPDSVPIQTISPPAPLPRMFDAESLEAAALKVIESDPFRLDRRPPSVAFGAQPAQVEVQPAAEPPPRPTLALTGIIGGPPWQAIVEGVPGRDGAVLVRGGDVLGNLRIRTIGPDGVVVEGLDTVWTLTLRRP